MTNQTLCVFARAPIKGQVKTRLAKALGDDVAMQVYRALLAHTGMVAANGPDQFAFLSRVI